MAKDLVDTMLEMIMDFFLWIFKMLVKLTVGLVKFLFGLIKSLFSGNKSQEANQTSHVDDSSQPVDQSDDEQVLHRTYSEVLAELDSFPKANSEYALKDELFSTGTDILFNKKVTFIEKAKLLSHLGNRINELFPEDLVTAGNIWVNTINYSYQTLNEWTQGFYESNLRDFRNAFDKTNKEAKLLPLEHYLTDIMSSCQALNSPDGKFSFTPSMLNGVKLPEWPLMVYKD